MMLTMTCKERGNINNVFCQFSDEENHLSIFSSAGLMTAKTSLVCHGGNEELLMKQGALLLSGT